MGEQLAARKAVQHADTGTKEERQDKSDAAAMKEALAVRLKTKTAGKTALMPKVPSGGGGSAGGCRSTKKPSEETKRTTDPTVASTGDKAANRSKTADAIGANARVKVK